MSDNRAMEEIVLAAGFNPASEELTVPVDLSPEHAQFILNNWKYPRQRKLNKMQLAINLQRMHDGEFVRSTLDVAVLPDGTKYLINGYHRLSAVVEYGRTVPFRILFQHLPTMVEVDKAYGRIDTNRHRSHTDNLAALGIAEELDVPVHLVVWANYATPLLMSKFARITGLNSEAVLRARSTAQRAIVLREHQDAIRLFHIATAGAPAQVMSLLRRSAVMAIALVTLQSQPEKAEKFWREVSHDSGLVRGTPQWALLNFLRLNRSDDNRPHVYARYIASAWNAYFTGRPLARMMIKRTEAWFPIVIEGSEYSRGKQQYFLKMLRETNRTLTEKPEVTVRETTRDAFEEERDRLIREAYAEPESNATTG